MDEENIIRAIVNTYRLWGDIPDIDLVYQSEREGIFFQRGTITGAYGIALALGIEDKVNAALRSANTTPD